MVISDTCFPSSRLHPSTQDMSAYLQLMTMSHPRSVRVQSYGHILKMLLGHWTVATSTALPLHVNVLPIEIAKVLHHRTVSLDVHLIFNLSLHILDGKGQQPTREYTRVPFQMALISLRVNIILQMQVSHLPINFLFLIMQSIIIWLNGVMSTPGMLSNLLSICSLLHIVYRPRNKEELFNLRHASARNVIKHIFGVLKCRFQILLLALEYSIY